MTHWRLTRRWRRRRMGRPMVRHIFVTLRNRPVPERTSTAAFAERRAASLMTAGKPAAARPPRYSKMRASRVDGMESCAAHVGEASAMGPPAPRRSAPPPITNEGEKLCRWYGRSAALCVALRPSGCATDAGGRRRCSSPGATLSSVVAVHRSACAVPTIRWS